MGAVLEGGMMGCLRCWQGAMRNAARMRHRLHSLALPLAHTSVLEQPPPPPSPRKTLERAAAGLAAAGIALVASAALGLVKNICKGRLLQVIATVSAVVAFYYPKPWTFPAVIIVGGLATIILKRKDVIKVRRGTLSLAHSFHGAIELFLDNAAARRLAGGALC